MMLRNWREALRRHFWGNVPADLKELLRDGGFQVVTYDLEGKNIEIRSFIAINGDLLVQVRSGTQLIPERWRAHFTEVRRRTKWIRCARGTLGWMPLLGMLLSVALVVGQTLRAVLFDQPQAATDLVSMIAAILLENCLPVLTLLLLSVFLQAAAMAFVRWAAKPMIGHLRASE